MNNTVINSNDKTIIGKSKYTKSILYAVLAALLYAINSPISKLLLSKIPPTLLAAYLYLGAGCGMLGLGFARRIFYKETNELKLTKKELPYTIWMVILDIAAPIFLMLGLKYSTAANASLLNNFEIVATSLIALLLFKEKVSKRLWCGIGFITLSSMLLSFEDMSSLSFSGGSLFVLLACTCWGFENNCTRKLSNKDPLQIVIVKGFGSGFGALIIGIILKEQIGPITFILIALLLGFVSYGLSIFFYVHAQRMLGAAKTSAYYAIAPFIGVLLSLIIFKEIPNIIFILAVIVMMIGTFFASTD